MWVNVAVSLAASSSWPALTVTVCAVAQSFTVKVSVSLFSVGPDRLRSVSEWPAMETDTLSEGLVASFTV